MSAIWRQADDEWRPLLPSGFPSEERLHDLIESAPNLLPLAGDPSVTVLGREVVLGSGRADLIAAESDGRLVVVEIKLRRNAEARRAVVAQVLTYAAFLKGQTAPELELLLRPYLATRGASSILDAVRKSDQASELEETVFADGLAQSLTAGAFRLVLVLDEAPSELVQLVGYLESISRGVKVDLVTVSAYEVGDEQILVPQRVDPEYQPQTLASSESAGSPPSSTGRREVDGSEAFEQQMVSAPEERQRELRRLLTWARNLETQGLATTRTIFGHGREVLLVWVRGEKGGLVSIWNDNGAFISLWRSVFVRLAWDSIETIEDLTGQAIGQGTTIKEPDDEVLDALIAAYQTAAKGTPSWNRRDFYVAFGDGPRRDWDDARELGFVSAGGGPWYSRSLKQLKPGHRVFVYIPKGSGVGGYVGVGEVAGEAQLARDFEVSNGDGSNAAYLDIARAPEAGDGRDDPELAEWVVPVRWLDARTRDGAVVDSDFFANQNSAVKLTHGYTLERLHKEFGVPEASVDEDVPCR